MHNWLPAADTMMNNQNLAYFLTYLAHAFNKKLKFNQKSAELQNMRNVVVADWMSPSPRVHTATLTEIWCTSTFSLVRCVMFVFQALQCRLPHSHPHSHGPKLSPKKQATQNSQGMCFVEPQEIWILATRETLITLFGIYHPMEIQSTAQIRWLLYLTLKI